MVPTDVKVALVDMLTDAGFPAIEATSFVSPKWVPQMADAAEVMARIRRKAGVRYPVLTPNMKGFEAALAAKADEVAVFVAASETFSQKNINCSIAESLERARPIFDAAAARRRARARLHFVRAGLSLRRRRRSARASRTSRRRCPDGRLRNLAGRHDRHRHRGQDAGVAHDCAPERVPVAALAGHFHDTYGQALTNVYAALEVGVATFDCSVAGLGGCPYAKGATGNVASEDVVYLLQGLGIDTGVDMARCAAPASTSPTSCNGRRCPASRAH